MTELTILPIPSKFKGNEDHDEDLLPVVEEGSDDEVRRPTCVIPVKCLAYPTPSLLQAGPSSASKRPRANDDSDDERGGSRQRKSGDIMSLIRGDTVGSDEEQEFEGEAY